MKMKFWICLLAVASLLGIILMPGQMESKGAAAAQQQPSSDSLPQQPAALAGAQAPTIPPSISTIWPVGMKLGASQIFTVEGRNLEGAREVLFDTPGFQANILSVKTLPEKARKIRINVDLGAEVPQGKKQEARIQVTASSTVTPGIHWFRIQTPLGTSNTATLDVGALPEIQERKSNQPPAQAQPFVLPATLVGMLDKPGDVDTFQFRGRAGEEVVFRVVASQLGSKLRSVLTLKDSSGKELAQAGKFSDKPDAVLTYKLPADGQYEITLSDQEKQGDKDHFYRLYAGALPYISSVFPLGVRAGHPAMVEVKGVNLGGIHEVKVNPPQWADGWTTVPVRVKTVRGMSLNTAYVTVDDEPELTEREPNNTIAQAQPIPVPAAINGYINSREKNGSPDEDYFRFRAQKGEHLTIEVAAARLGSPLDSVIEVLDSQGHSIPRAIVRCLNETSLTLADRDSRTRGYRLVSRTGFHDNDYLMVGEELDQIQFIPDQPDADILLKGYGDQRVALLGTSPQAHYVTEPAYRAEILPPGAKFPSNGLPVFRITYRNDDGGPGFGSDSRLDFVAPQDGEYILHIKDVRGLQGPDFAYQLIVRNAAPDFTLTASTENPNIPRGGRLPVEVTANRMLGYQGPIKIKVVGLPKWITAQAITIPAGQDSATLILQSSSDAPSWENAVPFKIEGSAWAGGHQLVRIADPETPIRVAALMPAPDLLIAAEPREITLRPGQTTTVTLSVSRENGFKGRVPCQIDNLPPGVRVVNVGLNGILVHSNETMHKFTLRAEDWAQPVNQPIYAVGEVESNSPTLHASAPILLKVEGKQEVASAEARQSDFNGQSETTESAQPGSPAH